MRIKAEFHVHTRFSSDSLLNKYLMLIVCKLKKIKLLAITDHNDVVGAQKYQKYLGKHGIDVIVGEEIMTKCGEIIGLYLTEKIEPNQSVETTIEEIKRQGGLVYLPHPYDEKRIKTVLKKAEQIKFKGCFDFIEIYNGRNISKEYEKFQTQVQLDLSGTPIIGGDAHTFYELGRNYIYMERPTRDTLIDCVKNGTFNKKKCIKFAHINTKLVKLLKIIMRGDFGELFRIVNRKCKRKNDRVI